MSAESDDLRSWPLVPKDFRPRALYHRGTFDEPTIEALRAKGYAPIDLLTLPRRTDGEQIEYLKCKAQAIEEGTLKASTEERMQTTLAMQTYGMLNPKSTRLNLNVNVETGTIDDLLAWQSSRHTLRGNTTLVGLTGKSLEDVQRDVTGRMLKARDEASQQVSALRAAEQRTVQKRRGKGKPRGVHKTKASRRSK